MLLAVSTPLLGSVDTALMGGISSKHLGAVGLGSQLFDIIFWSFGFLRMATTGLAGKAFGENDEPGLATVFFKNFTLALIISTIIIFLQNQIFSAGVTVLNGDAYATLMDSYFSARIWAAPASLGLYVVGGYYIGIGKVRLVLFLTILANLINIALSWWLVTKQGGGLAEVGFATAVAQYLALAIGLYAILFRDRLWSRYAAGAGAVVSVTLHGNIFVRTMALNAAFALFNAWSASLGEFALAANIIILKLLGFTSYALDGFAVAVETLVSQASTKERNEVRKIVSLAFRLALGFSVILCVLLAVLSPYLLPLFSSNPLVLTEATKVYLWLYPLVFVGCISYLYDGVFVGLTDGRTLRDSVLVGLLAMIVTFSFLQEHTSHAVWISLLAFLLGRATIEYARRP